MRIATGGLLNSSSSSPTGKPGDAFQDGGRDASSRSSLLFIGIFAGSFLLACLLQPRHAQATFQPQPQQMQSQYGIASGGMQYGAQPTNNAYGNMRVRTNINR
jgi:hypothetical protein